MNGTTKMNRGMLYKLCDDLILLKITNFHKYVGSWQTKWPSAVKLRQAKDKKRRAKEELIKTLTFTAKPLLVSYTTFGHVRFP